MDHKLVGILGAGVLVMGLTASWLLYPSPPPEVPKQDRRYMHCASCGQELRYDAKRCEKDCAYCGEKGPLVVTKESVKKTGRPPSPLTRLLPVLLVEFTALAAAVYWYASRRLRPGEEEEPAYPIFCPHCHRKLRFRRSQAGRLGQCPSCRRPIVFPRPPEPARRPWPARVWRKLVGDPQP